MKIIQSFWSKPFYSNKDSSSQADRSFGGYLNQEQFWMAASLSCLTINKFYDLELITDSHGKEILIDYLKLPYVKVRTDLDCLENYNSALWALGKIKSYSIQNEPFLHVDNDVYIWNHFPKRFKKSNLIAQSIERNDSEIYDDICEFIKYNSFKIPKLLESYIDDRSTNRICAYNAGIIGGCNTAFFKEFSKLAFDLINQNQNKLQLIDAGLFNIFFEQSLFYSLAKEKKVEVQTLFNNPKDNISNFIPIEFDLVPEKWYIHTIGLTKKYDTICEQIYLRLLNESPDIFYRIKNMSF
ncbi:DUF6734 family protein [Yeosuana sp.]|uniref:DUF6734 family protein n=1 Tax=Yeosuana sp. TaxID=2529388 RepID=UPI0040552875